jgi:hypothetical protein
MHVLQMAFQREDLEEICVTQKKEKKCQNVLIIVKPEQCVVCSDVRTL